MKHLRNKCLLLLLFAAATSLFARPSLKDLNIHVVLSRNGDARITETRQMNIDSEGTECYIVIGSLNGSEICDLTVSDETGLTFSNIGSGTSTGVATGKRASAVSSPSATAMSSAGVSATAATVPMPPVTPSPSSSKATTMPTASTLCSWPRASLPCPTTSG